MPGLADYLTINGTDLALNPDSLDIQFEENGQTVPTIGDSFRYYEPILAGLPVRDSRYSFTLPYANTGDLEAVSRALRRVQMKHGEQTLTIWRPVTAYYVATEGQTAFYLPRRRWHAPAYLAVNEADFPPLVWLNDVAQTVTVVAGNAPTTPSAGACNFGTTAVTSGSYKDYVYFKLAACTAGDVVEVEFYPLFRVRSESPGERYPGTSIESRDVILVER